MRVALLALAILALLPPLALAEVTVYQRTVTLGVGSPTFQDEFTLPANGGIQYEGEFTCPYGTVGLALSTTPGTPPPTYGLADCDGASHGAQAVIASAPVHVQWVAAGSGTVSFRVFSIPYP